jgi:putative ABC transport system permease protein
MPLLEIAAVALASLRANKLRAALTMLGIVVGIAAVVAVVGLGLGAREAVDARLAALGTRLLQVTPDRQRRGGVQWGDLRRLRLRDAEALTERGRTFAAVQPQQDRDLQVLYRNRNTVARVVGTTPNHLGVHQLSLAAGRMFTTGENRGALRVAVVGAGVVKDLGLIAPEALVGERIRIAGRQFTVIGVLESEGRTSPGNDPDQRVLIPLRTGRFRVFGNDRLNDIYVLASSEDSVPQAMAEIRTILRRVQRTTAEQPDGFRIRNQSDFLLVAADTSRVMTFLLAGIAAISLLVGGIGIMNIMIVSVTERTREIGIRKALGATRRVILSQFLAEAVVTSAAGGILGALAGVGLLLLARYAFDMSAAVSPVVLGAAVFFASAIGVLFGVWPARRAATLDPIVALRYE